MDKQPIVFAYWVNNVLKGFRSDTFGTISIKRPKIYHYSKEQVNIVLTNTRSMLNRDGSSFFNNLVKTRDVQIVTTDGQEHAPDTVVNHLTENEKTVRSWVEFELRVHPFIPYEGEWEYPEQWKIQAAITSLEPAIEVHKFQIVNNEN